MKTYHKNFSFHSISPFDFFSSLIKDQNAVLLDSAEQRQKIGDYSYVLWGERSSFRAYGKRCEIQLTRKKETRQGNPFLLFQDFFNRVKSKPNKKYPYFTSGCVGFFGYDTNAFLEKVPNPKSDPELSFFPDVYFFVPKNVIIFDHQKGKIRLFVHGGSQEKFNELSLKIKNFLKAGFQKNSSETPEIKVDSIRPKMKQKQFEAIVRRAKEYIAAGDIYQANLSQRFSFHYEGDPLSLYQKLREINPSPFASYWRMNDFHIVSSSPERLIRVRNGWCETRPIAGTRRRGKNSQEDGNLSKELLLNEKEKAEHLMLVDLERNDLGRVCDYRTVTVDEWMVLEKYSHVIHIVSNVKGKLSKTKNNFDAIRSLFPGGTITGCPKIRSMEIIHELEPVRRALYTGSIGYLGFDGNMDLNIVIRTILCSEDKGYIQVGAGIVQDSIPKKEYEETIYKAQAMLQAIHKTKETKKKRSRLHHPLSSVGRG